MKWESGEHIHVRVYSKKGGKANLEYRGKDISLETEKDMEYFPMKKAKDNW